MKTPPLPSVEEVIEIIGEYKKGRAALHCEMRERVTQDRNQAYTRLVEGIGNASFDNCDNYADGTHYCNGYEQACADILEKVVKPLYGKE